MATSFFLGRSCGPDTTKPFPLLCCPMRDIVVGVDGTVYAVNNAIFYAIGK